MVIAISDALGVPATTILELTWNVEPIPVFGHPLQRWCTISLIDFKNVESWRHSEEDESGCFPEFDPFANSGIFVDHVTLFKVEVGVRLHGWSLYEWLELVTWVGH